MLRTIIYVDVNGFADLNVGKHVNKSMGVREINSQVLVIMDVR